MKIASLLILLLVIVWAGSPTHAQQGNPALDKELIDALFENDLIAARIALERGANPEASQGRNVSEDAMCAAAEQRGTAAVELLLEYGARPDFYYQDRYRSHRTPLACAIRHSNPDVFAMLLDRGVDTEVELCPECVGRFFHTYVTEALAGSDWPMVLELVTRTVVDSREFSTLQQKLTLRTYDEAHPWSNYRAKVIDWVVERDPDFVARPASPMQPGQEQHCVQSYRDAIEGVLPGSICPE